MEHILIDEEEIASYLFKGLIEMGYVPKEEELEDISMIVFDYLIEVGAIETIEEEE